MEATVQEQAQPGNPLREWAQAQSMSDAELIRAMLARFGEAPDASSVSAWMRDLARPRARWHARLVELTDGAVPTDWIYQDPPPASIAARFWAKVKKGSGCWEWQAAVARYGYGKFLWRKSAGVAEFLTAHRAAWRLEHGEIPLGMFVCHHCDNPPCVRPEHLFLGTRTDNTNDMVRKGRAATGERNGALLHPERRARGENHGLRLHPDAHCSRAKYTDEQKRLAREAYAAGGMMQSSVARRFGMSRTACRKILAGIVPAASDTWRG